MRAQMIKKKRAARRVVRVRKKVSGEGERPRLAVWRSHQHIVAQVIDDTSGRTLCAAGTQMKDVAAQVGYGGNVKAAKAVGAIIGQKAKALGIHAVRFDRRGWRYHGRIKALADAAREAGLKF